MCGGNLEITEGMTVCECEYCGSKQTVPNADDEKKMKMYERANKLRFNCDFDKAAGIYENIVNEFSDEAEAYWGLVLCTYGIEYVDDPASGKKIPTCHRSSFDSVMFDDNFEQVMENSDSIARSVYREEAKAIEELRKGILEVSGKEEPYDIFICYKETDENGDRTIDSVMAQDVYDALTDKGYRVFFSRITLEDKLGMEYEPYIFAALNSAKVMLAFGTTFDYYHAVWVKNEWSRFLKLMGKDKEKYLIPCYKNIDAYDIPKEFQHLQAQDMGKVGALQDLMHGIEKLIGRKDVNSGEKVYENLTLSEGINKAKTALERGWMAIEDEEWKKADEFFEETLSYDAKNVDAYLGKLMASLQLRQKSDLGEQEKSFSEDSNYKKIIRFADEELKAELMGYLDEIAERNCMTVYNNAVVLMANAAYEEAISQLETICNFRDAKELLEKCINMKDIDEARKLLATVNTEEDLRAVVDQLGYNRYIPEIRAMISDLQTRFEESEKKSKEIERQYEEIKKELSRYEGLLFIDSSIVCYLRLDGDIEVLGMLEQYREEVCNWKDIVELVCRYRYAVGLKLNGKVATVGSNAYEELNLSNWSDIKHIVVSDQLSIGIKKDGTVVATGLNDRGQCNVSSWKDIVSVSTSGSHTVGLKRDGSVVATGYNLFGQCNVKEWTDIVAIKASDDCTVGLKKDGTVLATGVNEDGQCDVGEWRGIKDIHVIDGRTVGLCADGRVLTAGKDVKGKTDAWEGIVKVAVSSSGIVGLRFDGKVVMTKEGEDVYYIDGFKDMVDITIGVFVVGMKSNGEVLKYNQYEKRYTHLGNVFENADGFKEENLSLKQYRRKRIKENLIRESQDLKNELNAVKGFFAVRRKREIESRLEEIIRDIEEC